MKKLIIPIALLIVAGVCYGIYEYNKGPRNLSNEKTELQMDAGALVSAFEANENTANELYLDKVVEVSGTVIEIGTDGSNNIVLDAGNPMSTIICELGDESANHGLKIGEPAVIKGQCTGYLMDVIFVKCVVIK
ncbi:MAG: hypothetical protein ACI8XB_002597 [Patiriisocius sp.]|jgi:hypothetical protein